MRFIVTCLVLSLIAQPAFATTVQYYKLYVPTLTIGAETVPELKIETGLYRSYLSDVEIAGALQPYYARDLDVPSESLNLNPASTMHLTLEGDSHTNKCVLVLDITRMTPPADKEMQQLIAEGDITLGDILEKVVLATEQNLLQAISSKRCSIVVKGLEKHPAVKASLKPNSPLLKTVPNA